MRKLDDSTLDYGAGDTLEKLQAQTHEIEQALKTVYTLLPVIIKLAQVYQLQVLRHELTEEKTLRENEQ